MAAETGYEGGGNIGDYGEFDDFDQAMADMGTAEVIRNRLYSNFRNKSTMGKIAQVISSAHPAVFGKNAYGQIQAGKAAARDLVDQGLAGSLEEATAMVNAVAAADRKAIDSNVTHGTVGSQEWIDNIANDVSQGTGDTGTMTDRGRAEKEAQAYIDSDPKVRAAFDAAKANNPGWTEEKWAKDNFDQRKGEGQDVTWPEIDPESGEVADTTEPPAAQPGIAESFYNQYNQGGFPGSTGNALGGSQPAYTGGVYNPADRTGGNVLNWDPERWVDMEQNLPDGSPLPQITNPDMPGYINPIQTMGGAGAQGATRSTQNALLNGGSASPGGDINTPVWDMYNRGYGDIGNALTQGREDVTGFYEKGRGDVTGMYQEGKGMLSPYREAGERALGTYEKKVAQGAPGAGDLSDDPGYWNRVNDAMKAIERSAAAKNALQSGSTMKAMNREAQDYASNEYQNMVNRYYQSLTPYQDLAGMGYGAAGQTAGLGANAGNVLAQMSGQTGANLSGLEQWGGGARAGLSADAARLATGNVLQKEGLGTDWARIALAESEAGAGRDWTSAENVLLRDWQEGMAEKGYDFYGQQAASNQRNTLWNSFIAGGGYLAGGLLNN